MNQCAEYFVNKHVHSITAVVGLILAPYSFLLCTYEIHVLNTYSWYMLLFKPHPYYTLDKTEVLSFSRKVLVCFG